MATPNRRKPSNKYHKPRRQSTASYETSSTCSSRSSRKSASTRATTPTSAFSNNQALTPATTLSTIGEEEDVEVGPPSSKAEREDSCSLECGERLVEDINTLKARSLSLEKYSTEGSCSGHLRTQHCQDARSLLLILGDYTPEPRGKLSKKERQECQKIINAHTIRIGNRWHCILCNIGFTKQFGRYDFIKHIRSHLCAAHRPYHCFFKGCAYTDSQHSNMRSHLNRHTGERLVCEDCGMKDIKHRVELCRHRKQVHPERKESFAEAQAHEDSEAAHPAIECDIVNAMPASSWSWSMLRSDYDFSEKLGSFSPVPMTACVYSTPASPYTH